MVALPTWAEKMTPVDMDGAAALLGVSRRFLVDVLRTRWQAYAPAIDRNEAGFVLDVFMAGACERPNGRVMDGDH